LPSKSGAAHPKRTGPPSLGSNGGPVTAGQIWWAIAHVSAGSDLPARVIGKTLTALTVALSLYRTRRPVWMADLTPPKAKRRRNSMLTSPIRLQFAAVILTRNDAIRRCRPTAWLRIPAKARCSPIARVDRRPVCASRRHSTFMPCHSIFSRNLSSFVNN
jgi:hypothetical protein